MAVMATRHAPKRVPKHVQVREYVRELLADAHPGEPAPSERDLVHRFGVARMTVRQAMDGLVAEGLLQRMPGRGTFVTDRASRPRPDVHSYTEEMRRRGLLPESQTLLARREKAGPGVARALSISEGDSVIHWRRLRRADGVPMCLQDAYLNEVLLPGFLQTGMPTSLYAALGARGLRPTWAEDSVSAAPATSDEGDLLDVAVGTPVLRAARRALSDERAVEVTRSVYRSDRYTMWVRVTESR